MKCPTCDRVIRRKKAETQEDRLKRIRHQAMTNGSMRLRAPMPKSTRFKEGV